MERKLPVLNINSLYYLLASMVALIAIWNALRAYIQTHRNLRALKNSNYNENDFKRVTSIYVKPYTIDMDPCEAKDLRYTHGTRECIFSFMDRLLNESTDKYNILLADSGMGKTAFLLNYFARHYRTRRRRKYKIFLFPLGSQRNQPNQDLEQYIHTIPKEERKDAVLFLDAFDEDQEAINNHHNRLIQIFNLASEFRSVLITCRTQFFTKDEEIPNETGVVKVTCTTMNESRTYKLYKFYIAPFNHKQVTKYIHQKFPFFFLHIQKNERGFKRKHWLQPVFWPRRRAWRVINKISDLRFRPMILTYIDYLMEINKEMNSLAQIYEAIVDGWLERETPIIDKDAVRTFCEKMAVELFDKYHSDRIPGSELELLAKQFGINLPQWQLGGRSLLNRDATGNYKFAHRSIMEYLYAYQIITAGISANAYAWNSELLIRQFVVEMIQQNIHQKKSHQSLDLRGANLTGIDLLLLKEAKVSGAKLTGVKYNGVEFMRQAERLKMPLQEWSALLESFEDSEKISVKPNFGQPNYKRKAYDLLAKQFYYGPDGNSFNEFKDFQQFMATIAYDLSANQHQIIAGKFNEYCQQLAGNLGFLAAVSHEPIANIIKQETSDQPLHVLIQKNNRIQFALPGLAEYYTALYIELYYLNQNKPGFIIPNQVVADFICFEKDNLRFIPGGKISISKKREFEIAQFESFYIGICPVTNLEYERFNPEHKKQRDKYFSADDEPVAYVSWDDANHYCEWLTKETGRIYRLPTEAEWEYACRAGSTGPYSLDIDGIEVNETNLKKYAVYATSKTMPVKQRKPNFFGLYDIHGNVWEWCQDYSDNTERYRVLRGGSWFDPAELLRSSYCFYDRPDSRINSLGFRVVLGVARTL
jgi:hypothetical protein